jgi:carbon-monoxide dehydrogenase medium subunit
LLCRKVRREVCFCDISDEDMSVRQPRVSREADRRDITRRQPEQNNDQNPSHLQAILRLFKKWRKFYNPAAPLQNRVSKGYNHNHPRQFGTQMHSFELIQPSSLPQALEQLAQKSLATSPLAGGTDMVVDIRARRAAPDVLVSLQELDELRGITRSNGSLRIGASTTIAEFLKHPELMSHQALPQAAFVFASPMVRNLATIAGNIGSASPAGDMLPPLLALDAQIHLANVHETRVIPLSDFFLGPRETARRADELITALTIPVSRRESRNSSAFYKLGLRRADAISLVSVAVWLERDGEKIRDLRIALGAVAPRPLCATRAEAILRGATPSETNLREAARIAATECSPIDDLRASAQYRRRMVEIYVRRMLEQAWNSTN